MLQTGCKTVAQNFAIVTINKRKILANEQKVLDIFMKKNLKNTVLAKKLKTCF
jgi:Asp/Glu/hydantoin racemase